MKKTYGMLMVDDEASARRYALSQVEWQRLGIDRLYEAGNGFEALEILAREKPEILILDIRMPGMDGMELLDEICRLKYDVSIIGLSGYSDFDAARKMLSSGKVVEYLLKPASVDELFEAVTRAVGKIQERDRLEEIETQPKSREGAAEERPVEAGKCPNGVSTKKQALIRAVKEYIDAHYAEKITLEQAAAQVYTNPSYLSRLFTEVEGIGLNKYIQKIRVEKAKELLKDPRIRVYEVGDRVGYPNFQHFLKIFKQCTGMTPSKYRESSWMLENHTVTFGLEES